MSEIDLFIEDDEDVDNQSNKYLMFKQASNFFPGFQFCSSGWKQRITGKFK